MSNDPRNTVPITYSRGQSIVDRKVNALNDLKINDDQYRGYKVSFDDKKYVGLHLPNTNYTPTEVGIKSIRLPYSEYAGQDRREKKLNFRHPEQSTSNLPITIGKRVLPIYVYRGTEVTLDEFNILCKIFISLYYAASTTYVVSEQELLCNFITFFASVAPRFRIENNVNDMLRSTNEQVRFIEIYNFQEFSSHFFSDFKDEAGIRGDPTYYSHKKVLGRIRTTVCEALDEMNIRDEEILQALVMVILQTIGRRPTTEAYAEWFKSRIRAAVRVIGNISHEPYEAAKPDFDAMHKSYNSLSSRFEVKRVIALTLFEFSYGFDNIWQRMSTHILDMLRYTEMVYIYNIDQFLCTLYPELLSIDLLAQESDKLIKMAMFLKKHDYNEHIKLFLSERECTAISRANLEVFVIASTIIARRYYTSYKNYKVDETSKVYIKLKNAIDAHLDAVDQADPQRALTSKRFVIDRSVKADMIANQRNQLNLDVEPAEINRPVIILDSNVNETKLS